MLEPTRHTFLHFSLLLKLLFYLLAAVSIGVASWKLRQRTLLWKKGKKLDYKVQPLAEIKTLVEQVLLQRKVVRKRKRYGAPMHLMIFYGFLALFIGTTLLAINDYSPFKFHRGWYYLIYEATLDLMGLGLLVGTGMAIARRWFKKPKTLGHGVLDTPFLLLLFFTTLTGYTAEAARLANTQFPDQWARWSPVGNAIKPLFGGLSNTGYQVMWWVHVVLVLLFFVAIVSGRMLHLVLIPGVALTRPRRPMGELAPISLEEVEKTGKIGAIEAGDYSQWHLMSTDACMECGRCTEVCPANAVGKVLNPKHIVQDLKGLMQSDGRTVAEALNPEALMECTTCHACVRECPALIRHVDIIIDARRAMVAEGQVSGSSATMLRQLTSTENPWGLPAAERESWMTGLDIPLARDGGEYEVLLWVGCAGAFDRRAQSTTKAFAALMKKAGVKFACLGKEERCTGDPARRTGDEFLYQQLAMSNVETLKTYKVKKIVTSCPHCFNTFKNEYHQFEGDYEVLHHTQLLAQLIEEGKLQPFAADGSVTFHDPCYLARVNNESNAPRSLVEGALAEPEAKKDKTFCCGAGGGRMWMEEPPNQRPGVKRANQLLATGAKTIGVACPFCKIMVGDSVAMATQEEVNIVDLAELMLKRNQATEQDAVNSASLSSNGEGDEH